MSAQEMPLWGEHSQGVTAHVVTLTDKAVWHSFQDSSKLERNSSENQKKPTLGQLNIKFTFRCFKNGFPTATIRAQDASGRIYLNFTIEVKPKPYQFSHLNTNTYEIEIWKGFIKSTTPVFSRKRSEWTFVCQHCGAAIVWVPLKPDLSGPHFYIFNFKDKVHVWIIFRTTVWLIKTYLT